MTSVACTDRDTAAPHRRPPACSSSTVFVSAALVFLVEPMIGKLVLPELGGSPAVWNTAWRSSRRRCWPATPTPTCCSGSPLSVADRGPPLVLVAAALALPLRVTTLFGEPMAGASDPVAAGRAGRQLGPPFAALSATAPLAAGLVARGPGRSSGRKNPYVLYAASNLGSLLALLAYPAVVEPLLSLSHPDPAGASGYAAFWLLMPGLARDWCAPAADARRSRRVAPADQRSRSGASAESGSRWRPSRPA